MTVIGLAVLAIAACSPVWADPPTVNVIPDQVISEGGRSSPIPFTISVTNLNNLRLEGSASDSLLIPSTNIIFGGTGRTRTVSVGAMTNRFGQTTVTVQASNDSGSAITTFGVTVNARINIEAVQGRATAAWSATNAVLQVADQANGPWVDLFPFVSSPYPVAPGGTHFYRLRHE